MLSLSVEPIEYIESPSQELNGITENSGSNPKLEEQKKESYSSVFAQKEKERRERQVSIDTKRFVAALKMSTCAV